MSYNQSRSEERQRFMELQRHPDCRDPEHPGCENCDESRQREEEQLELELEQQERQEREDLELEEG